MGSWKLQKLYLNTPSGLQPVDPLPEWKFDFGTLVSARLQRPFWLLLETATLQARVFAAEAGIASGEELTGELRKECFSAFTEVMKTAANPVAQGTSIWLLVARQPMAEALPPLEGRKLPEAGFLKDLTARFEKDKNKQKLLQLADGIEERHDWVMELLGQDRYNSRSSFVSERFYESIASYLAYEAIEELRSEQSGVSMAPVAASKPQNVWAERVHLHILEIRVGRALLSLVDPNEGSPLVARVGTIRNQVHEQLGIIIPGIRFRDDLNLPPDTYEIALRGQVVARGQLRAKEMLSIGPLHKLEEVVQATPGGAVVQDPVYAMPGCWTDQREVSEKQGCMLFSAEQLLGAHLVDVIFMHAAEIFDFDAFEGLMELHRNHYPRLHRELERRSVERFHLWNVLKELLSERVSIRDLSLILETLIGHAQAGQAECVERCRRALWRQLTRVHAHSNTDVEVVGLSSEQEDILRRGEASEMLELGQKLVQLFRAPTDRGRGLVFLVAPEFRRTLRDLLRPSLPRASFLSLEEIDGEQLLEVIELTAWREARSLDAEEPASEPIGWKARLQQVRASLRDWWTRSEAV